MLVSLCDLYRAWFAFLIHSSTSFFFYYHISYKRPFFPISLIWFIQTYLEPIVGTLWPTSYNWENVILLKFSICLFRVFCFSLIASYCSCLFFLVLLCDFGKISTTSDFVWYIKPVLLINCSFSFRVFWYSIILFIAAALLVPSKVFYNIFINFLLIFISSSAL